MGYQDLTEAERTRVREQFYNPETTQEKRIELIRMMQNSADEAKMGRQCPRCKHFPYFVPYDEALLEGHVYSEEGMAEIGITGYCEFCFDLITEEPEEEEPVTGNVSDEAHLEGCPLRRPELYDPDEQPLECRCPDLIADRGDYADPDQAADDLAPPRQEPEPSPYHLRNRARVQDLDEE